MAYYEMHYTSISSSEMANSEYAQLVGEGEVSQSLI